MTVNEILMLVIAAWLAIFALIVNTKGLFSALFFKVSMFTSAVTLFLIAFKLI